MQDYPIPLSRMGATRTLIPRSRRGECGCPVCVTTAGPERSWLGRVEDVVNARGAHGSGGLRIWRPRGLILVAVAGLAGVALLLSGCGGASPGPVRGTDQFELNNDPKCSRGEPDWWDERCPG